MHGAVEQRNTNASVPDHSNGPPPPRLTNLYPYLPRARRLCSAALVEKVVLLLKTYLLRCA